MNEYTGYFRDHYKYKLTQNDIVTLHKWFFAQWNTISKKVVITKKTKILEIGSGIGVLYSFLDPLISEGNYVGLELDKHAVAFARKQFQTNAFENISIEEYDRKEKFDVIFAFEVLEHVSDPNMVISKIHRLLAEGGIFIGTSPYPYSKNVYADETHRYVLHPSNWSKLFYENEFKKVSTHPMSFAPFLWRLNKHLNIKVPFYIPFPSFISTTLLVAYK